MGVLDALFGGPKFNAPKCKTALRLCVGRVKLLRNKKANAVVNLKREIADLLNAGKDDSARVRVEAVLREEATLEAFEVLDLFCELLIVRLPLIESTKDLPADLKEAVATVVYAARRVADEIPELKTVKSQFAGKYGSQYVAACGEDATASACGVSELAIRKLALAPPSAETRLDALRAVAAERGARFDASKMAEATADAKKAPETSPTATGKPRSAPKTSSGHAPPTAGFVDAGHAAAAARAAAAEAATAADAASRLAGLDTRARAAPRVAERTVGVITSRTPVPPPGFLVEAPPPPSEGPGAERGASVSRVVGADADDADDADDASGKPAVDASGEPAVAAASSPEARDGSSEEEDVSVFGDARPSPPPGVGGAPPRVAERTVGVIMSPPPEAGEEVCGAEDDETEGDGANRSEDFDALASRLAALKRRDDE